MHTVLIVDDQEINRKILHRILQKDYLVLEADNGRVALDILQEKYMEIDAILLDIVMPVMNGYAVLEALNKNVKLSKIPVIVSSQRDGDESEVKALSLGAQDFIAKPYKADIILHRLKNMIRLRETAAIINRTEKDELTGLLNKQFFVEQVNSVIHQNTETQYDILCFDIEKFKLVNDTYGIETGDELLRHMANVIRESPFGVLSARFDADHFYQIVERSEDDKSEVFRIYLEKVRSFSKEIKVNINCGIYQVDRDENVISMCDRAKLAADINRGEADKLFSYYDDSIRQKLLEEQFIVSSMKAGIERHEFIVYYQPKYDLHTEMVAGAEALVRWIHPERGFLSPGAFIPIFEKNGFIMQMDRYVWEQACKDIRKWMDAGIPPVPVSVNVSRADIFNPNLESILVDLLKRYEIPMSYLHLEITESAYTDNPEQIISVVKKLHDLGFVIEMDDFGSGYSSLNMLAELPVDILKLDMKFVQTETKNTSGKGIISFVISLAKWMKLSVIAEGVETVEQIEALRSMDCNFVQGFYFAKPMAEPDFEETLRTTAVSAIEQTKVEEENLFASLIDAEHAPEKEMLIVDDIELNRTVLMGIFIKEYRIVEKENGKDALRYLRQNPGKVEIILLDLLMPVMDGFQFLEALRKDNDLKTLPVIVTSQGDITAEERALEIGADDFISKPYSPRIVKHRVHNITKIHQISYIQQKELDITRQREQTLLESIPGGVAIYHIKKDGRIPMEYASDGLARMCGYTVEELLATFKEDARKNTIPEDMPRLTAAIEEAYKKHTSIHELHHVYTKDRKIITVRLDANVITSDKMDDDDEALLYAVHTVVSEDAENVLQEQYRYRYIMDNLDVAYFELDSDGRFYASDKYSLYVMSDEKPENILQDTGRYEGIHPEDLPIMFEFFSLKKTNMPKISVTLRLLMKDGTYRWTDMMGFFEYDENGKRIKSVGILRDVDSEMDKQNRKLEEALAVAEKANQAKTDFLAKISHEMRTPLNGILGLTELMTGKKAGEDIAEDVEELKQSGHYLLNLINDTLDVSTIEQGRMKLNPVVCDGETALVNVINMVRPSVDVKKIRFEIKADDLPFTRLYLDVGRLEQAILNVLGNAVKFTSEGGKIEFIMENISKENGIITDRITVRDNGIGMSQVFLQHIFEPFSQEHNDNKSSYSGAGLGMTIAKQCIELMGGSIEVFSEKDKGTEVIMLIPMPIATRQQLEEWSAQKGDTSLQALTGKRILLCEDHPLNAQIAMRFLRKREILVEHAENGKIGVEMFEKSPLDYYDAVLMDIRMPIMNGLEACKRIRALKRKDARCLPIIAMTANVMHQDIKASLNAGMTEHLGKPVEPLKLYHTLTKLIANPNPFAGKKILVVDDVEMNRVLVNRAIRDTYTIVEASSGVEALEILNREEGIVGIVTDIQMPLMDGKELIQHIRENPKYDKLAILANTIYGDHRQEDELLALGANDFVYKPSSPQVILMRLEHILRNLA